MSILNQLPFANGWSFFSIKGKYTCMKKHEIRYYSELDIARCLGVRKKVEEEITKYEFDKQGKILVISGHNYSINYYYRENGEPEGVQSWQDGRVNGHTKYKITEDTIFIYSIDYDYEDDMEYKYCHEIPDLSFKLCAKYNYKNGLFYSFESINQNGEWSTYSYSDFNEGYTNLEENILHRDINLNEIFKFVKYKNEHHPQYPWEKETYPCLYVNNYDRIGNISQEYYFDKLGVLKSVVNYKFSHSHIDKSISPQMGQH
jgi:hypothetical protein